MPWTRVVSFMNGYENNLDILFVIRTRTINSIPSIPDYRQAIEIDLPIVCSKNSM